LKILKSLLFGCKGLLKREEIEIRLIKLSSIGTSGTKKPAPKNYLAEIL
jgi:hypothetical protein